MINLFLPHLIDTSDGPHNSIQINVKLPHIPRIGERISIQDNVDGKVHHFNVRDVCTTLSLQISDPIVDIYLSIYHE